MEWNQFCDIQDFWHSTPEVYFLKFPVQKT